MQSIKKRREYKRIVQVWLLAAIVALAGALVFIYLGNRHAGVPDRTTASSSLPSGTNRFRRAGILASAPPPAELARREALYPSFQKHPFLVAHDSKDFGWTAEDGKNPDVIRQLAHNELEFQRMAEETSRIFRRQLVYVKEPADLLVQQSRASGQAIQEFPLPGFDGQEYQIEVTGEDLNASGQQGTFTGHIAGQLDSSVTFAFKGGREAFTILSPSDHTYLMGEPREPGELVVKSIDPATYVVGACGNP